MRVVSDPQPDPRAEDPKAVVVRVEPGAGWRRPVTLAEIKADELLADWELVRLPRLSVVPVTPAQWQRLEELSLEPS
jgi:predicted RNA-binding protein with PUA-like domain